jgi:hypothetical protein
MGQPAPSSSSSTVETRGQTHRRVNRRPENGSQIVPARHAHATHWTGRGGPPRPLRRQDHRRRGMLASRRSKVYNPSYLSEGMVDSINIRKRTL